MLNKKQTPVSTLMLGLDDFPVVDSNTILKQVLERMSACRLGVACVVSDDNTLEGVITDGDIRRKILTVQKPFSAFLIEDISQHMVKTVTSIQMDAPLEEASRLMGEKQIWDLPVLDKAGKLQGLLHLHPVVENLLRAE